MNKRIAGIVAGLAVSAIFTTSVIAEGTSERVEAYVNKEIKITLDNEALALRNADDSIIYPVIYNDRTYLPMRAIAQVLGIKVDWDLDTKTVSLTESEKADEITVPQENPQPVSQKIESSMGKIDKETARLKYAIRIPADLDKLQVTTWGKGKMNQEVQKARLSEHALGVSIIEYIDSTPNPVRMATITVYYEKDFEGIKDKQGLGDKLGSLDNKIYMLTVESNPYTTDSEEYSSYNEAMIKLNDNRYYISIGYLG